MIESLLLALVDGLVGGGLAHVAFNNLYTAPIALCSQPTQRLWMMNTGLKKISSRG